MEGGHGTRMGILIWVWLNSAPHWALSVIPESLKMNIFEHKLTIPRHYKTYAIHKNPAFLHSVMHFVPHLNCQSFALLEFGAESWLGRRLSSFFRKKNYIFLALLGPHCCMQAFSSCSKRGLLSSCGEWASHCRGFPSCRAQALGRGLMSCAACTHLPHSMWDRPRPGIELVCLALQGGFLTTGPPGKPEPEFFDVEFVH